MDQLVKENKILTFVGTGGVGKTTLSLSLAIYAASKGLKVAAITIDPSKRLARTLGLQGNSFQQLQWPEFAKPMDVFFLDAQQAFAEFVQSSLSEAMYKKIETNKIFRQISKNLRETHNFAAIYKLDQILSSAEYDLIVLDTPPSHQAIEFFESPKKLQKFFTQKKSSKRKGVFNWIQDKGFEVVENIMLSLAGHEFISETESFFSHIGKLREDINVVSQNFLENMLGEKSQLLLVSSPALDKINEASFLQKSISAQGYSIRWCVINRSFHKELDLGKEPLQIQDPLEQELYNYFRGQKQKSKSLISQLSSEGCFKSTQFVMLPEFSDLSESQESLAKLAQRVDENWQIIK